jgi:hypothetical protein
MLGLSADLNFDAHFKNSASIPERSGNITSLLNCCFFLLILSIILFDAHVIVVLRIQAMPYTASDAKPLEGDRYGAGYEITKTRIKNRPPEEVRRVLAAMIPLLNSEFGWGIADALADQLPPLEDRFK